MQMMNIRCFTGACIAIATTLFTTQYAIAEIVAEHIGSTDPVSEGWTEYREFSGVQVGPINDGGTEAWFVDDDSSAGRLIYSKALTASQSAALSVHGGELTVMLRMVDGAGSVPPVFAAFNAGGQDFAMRFGAQPDGTTTVTLLNNIGQPVVVANAGTGYRTFKLRYDPSTTTSDLFVDGVERYSNYEGVIIGNFPMSPRWGSLNGNLGVGQGNFSKVQFDVLPEPSTVTLFLLAGVPFVAFRRR